MKKYYLHKFVENYVQDYYLKNKIFKAKKDIKKKKYYCLSMIPYPSGDLHIGHIRNYTIGDVISRFHRMLGKNVLQTIGWDSFGLPAEIAAIKNNTLPYVWINKNIKKMRNQLKSFGFSYDWDREINTCDPEYYKWEQILFIKLYKKKIIYRKKKIVNWCPNDKTVLANEQVINNRCWRCETNIKYKIISQWFIKIKNYASELLRDLKNLKNWPDKVKNMQKKWIGFKKKIKIKIKIINCKKKITIFTRYPNLIININYIGISIFNKIIKYLKLSKKKIKKIILNFNKTNIKKFFFTGFYSINPITSKIIPIFIVNYIFKNSFFGISSYDKKYKFKIKNNILYKGNYLYKKRIYIKKGILLNSGKYNGLNYKESFKLISKKIGKKKYIYKLHDWCISRQRYWGVPIPVIKRKGKIKCIPRKFIPVLLPKINKLSDLKYPIEKNLKYKKIFIKNKEYKLEKDTFDTFLESSWYYIRYLSPRYKKDLVNKKIVNYWLPIDQYIGGIEHSNMHLIYLRFFNKLLRDLNYVKCNEPVNNLICQGIVLSDAFYYIKNNNKKWINKEKLDIKSNNNIIYKNKKIFYAGKIKMSKSKCNGIDLNKLLKKYGADTIRIFILFSSPVNNNLIWNEFGILGIERFIKRLWKIVWCYKYNKYTLSNIEKLNLHQKEILNKLNDIIINVYKYIKINKFNVAISKIMNFVNILFKSFINNKLNNFLIKQSISVILRLLYPFAPHLCFILWKYIKEKDIIDNQSWPKIINFSFNKISFNLIIVKINNKLRAKIKVSNDLSKINIIKKVKNHINVKKYIINKKINKIIYIPNKIINILV